MDKQMIIYSLILLAILVLAVVSPKIQDVNPVIGLAIADQKVASLARYDTMTVSLGTEKYLLSVNNIAADRKSADFILESDTKSGAPYFKQYFKLSFEGKDASMYGNPDIIRVYPNKSKVLYISDEKKLYIEILSIQNRQANLLIKWIK